MSSRKDDPVFNVKFVQLVESKPCLWNSTLPEYSKKDEIQKAWQEVANETKDTVRNCRERWRTIRSSFLRSLKLSRTSTGRGKRKYYLSKYLQFLIPFTKTRLKNSSTIIAQRKAAAAGNIPPMTRISNMPIVSSDDTKDSSNSADVAGIAEGDVVVSLHEGAIVGGVAIAQHAPLPLPQPLNLQAIKQEKDVTTSGTNTIMPPMDHLLQSLDHQRHFVNNSTSGCINNSNNNNHNNINNNNITNPTMNNNLNTTNNGTPAMNATNHKNTSSNSSNNNSNIISAHPPQSGPFPHPTETRSSSAVDLTEFAEWIKSKNEHQRHCLMTTSPDADQSFLNSLHPYLREMSGKQNRRFRQKVVALIDAVLDNAD
ncbi:type-2 histone deacetylase 1 [Calliphora vicina]|uniref:type-2 histone deacetylase 1 n=1 Tax=Calliphora vicina TaxID=7373 RepID=UPI00325A62DA